MATLRADILVFGFDLAHPPNVLMNQSTVVCGGITSGAAPVSVRAAEGHPAALPLRGRVQEHEGF